MAGPSSCTSSGSTGRASRSSIWSPPRWPPAGRWRSRPVWTARKAGGAGGSCWPPRGGTAAWATRPRTRRSTVLRHALDLPLAYVGAMGSRRTAEDRRRRLRAAGVTEAALARLHAPIGLDLGGQTPEETAVSIAAEIVAVTRGGGGAPLSRRSGRIHADAPG
ncbi:XdhC family protein [Micromonospora chersina]|uniref:XdhC family protein n=1 Tax=Micromonospora chersina TaxID=47854 RepID=UPI003451F0FB